MTEGRDGATWQRAVDLLRSHRQVTLACHVSPDGDALGSMLALGLGLRSLGHQVTASHGTEPFATPSSLAFLPGQDLLVAPGQLTTAPDLLVTFDTGSVDRLGSLAALATQAREVLVVDHHATNTRFGTVNLVETTAASTTVLVDELLTRLGVLLTMEIATALYVGLVTDTGSFKYAATTPSVHLLAARLLEAGVQHAEIARDLFDTSRFAVVELSGRALGAAQLDEPASLVFTTIRRADRLELGVRLEEVEGVIDSLRVAAEAEVAMVCKEAEDGNVLISLRSKGITDVGAICQQLGGGGHRFAAGLTFHGSADEAVAAVRALLTAT